MARGWESKSVEEQMAEVQVPRPPAEAKRLTPQQQERRRKQNVLQTTRALVAKQLADAQNPRYRTLLETELASIDKQLQELSTQVA